MSGRRLRYFGRPVQRRCAALIALLSASVLTANSGAQELVNAARLDGVEVPLRVYWAEGQGCDSLAVISPGAGGTEKGYAYLAAGLRDHAWVTIVMGHKESGPAALRKGILSSGIRGGLKDMVGSRDMQEDRMLDLEATMAWIAPRCRTAYKVLLGHSMGSDTVMFEAGARNKLEIRGVDRFDAYVAISPSGHGSIFAPGAWSNIHKPMYILTGTRDKGLEGEWEWRTEPYHGLPQGCHWLGVVDGATHLDFAGIGIAGKTERLTLESVNAFLTSARRGQCAEPGEEPGISITSQATSGVTR